MQRAKRRSPLRQSCPGVGGSNPPLSAATHLTQREIYRGVGDMKLRFDEVLYDLEQERQRVDEDLRRLAVVAAYLRTLLLPPRRRRRVPQRRRRCNPRRSLPS